MATTPSSVLGTQSVTLAWNPVTNANVAGYNIYYGSASGNYTNVTSVGNVTNATISGLTEGATYYFATTTLEYFRFGKRLFQRDILYGSGSQCGARHSSDAGEHWLWDGVGGDERDEPICGTERGDRDVERERECERAVQCGVGGELQFGGGQTQAVVVVFSPLAAGNYTQSVSFSVSGGTGMNVTVSGSATNVSSATVPSPPSVITRTITADITNLITLQFTTNLTSPSWRTLGVLAGFNQSFFYQHARGFLRGVCNNLTGSVTLSWPPSTDLFLVGLQYFFGHGQPDAITAWLGRQNHKFTIPI